MVKNNNVLSFFYIRVLSCVGILILHILNSAVGLYNSTVNINVILTSKIIVNLLLWCVPCFVMITGALLLNPEKSISYKKIFSKYISRILFALVFCCFLFSIFDLVMHGEQFTFQFIFNSIKNIFLGTSWSHLWYLYLLLAIYLMLPIYRLITKSASNKDVKYLLCLYFIFLSAIYVLQVFGVYVAFYIMVSSIYPFYLFFGYAYKNNIVEIKNLFAIIIFILSSICLAFVTYYYNIGVQTLEVLLNYSSIFVVLQSVSLFCILNNIKWKENKFIKVIDQCSFGIYLLHMIFVKIILKYLCINPYDSLIMLISVISVTFLFSFCTTIILKKIPFIKSFI